MWYFLWHSTISTLFCLTILICLSLSSYVLVLPLKNGLRQIIIFGFAALSDDVIILEPQKWRLIQKFLEKSRTNKNFTFLKVKVNGFLQCHKTPYTSIKFLFIIKPSFFDCIKQDINDTKQVSNYCRKKLFFWRQFCVIAKKYSHHKTGNNSQFSSKVLQLIV